MKVKNMGRENFHRLINNLAEIGKELKKSREEEERKNRFDIDDIMEEVTENEK